MCLSNIDEDYKNPKTSKPVYRYKVLNNLENGRYESPYYLQRKWKKNKWNRGGLDFFKRFLFTNKNFGFHVFVDKNRAIEILPYIKISHRKNTVVVKVEVKGFIARGTWMGINETWKRCKIVEEICV
jgi:hypothetical protein